MSLELTQLIGLGAGGSGGNAPSFVAASTGAVNTGANTLAVNYPSGIQANDIIICVVGGESSSGTSGGDTTFSVSGVSNFTAIGTVDNSDGKGASYIGYKRATGSESGTETATMSNLGGIRAIYGVMFLFRGCIQSGNPTDALSNAENAASATWNQKSLTTTVADELACHLVIARGNSATAGNFTGETNGDFTETSIYSSASGAIQLQTSAAPSPTTISGGSVGASVSAIYNHASFGLKPP